MIVREWKIRLPNERTAGNGAISISLHVERLARAVPECER